MYWKNNFHFRFSHVWDKYIEGPNVEVYSGLLCKCEVLTKIQGYFHYRTLKLWLKLSLMDYSFWSFTDQTLGAIELIKTIAEWPE